MATRIRTRVKSYTTGGGKAVALQAGIGDVIQSPAPQFTEWCKDEDSGDHYYTNTFELNLTCQFFGWVNGKTSNYWLLESWEHGGTYLVPSSFPGAPSHAQSVTRALAITNPSRPSVDVVQFLAELRDAPRMIKQIGDLLTRMSKAHAKGKAFKPTPHDVASGYLGWTFGWKPLLDDLAKLLDFSEALDKRMKDLEDLKAGSLRKTARVFSGDSSVTWTDYVGPSYQAVARANFKADLHRDVWVRVRYKPTPYTYMFLGDDIRSAARSLVFGHHLDPSTIWELLPWSWLLDWFTTTGDWFAANRNHLGVQVDDIAVMTQTTGKIRFTGWHTNPYGATFKESANAISHRKWRNRGFGPVITLKTDILSLGQWSILSALAVTRFSRPPRG